MALISDFLIPVNKNYKCNKGLTKSKFQWDHTADRRYNTVSSQWSHKFTRLFPDISNDTYLFYQMGRLM